MPPRLPPAQHRPNASPLDPAEPACTCCPHLTWEKVERDAVLLWVWDQCTASVCLAAMCPTCSEG